MNLPFINKFRKETPPSNFLVLVLRDEKVNAVIFQEIEGRVKIIGQKEEYFVNSIDHISSEEFLETLDKAISHAESSLPENVQTQKTIFGVKESWTENDQIKKEYLSRLKKASEELGLTPIGFLVISQAISHMLQKEEGAPVSAILAEVNKKTVTVTLVRAGKSIETKTSEIHESIPFTVDTLLKHFDIPEILPSRIIIFNGKEDLSQEFISHTWSKSLPFLHLPQITNLPHGFDAKAVLFGAATQMGFAITASNKVPSGTLSNADDAEIRKKDETHKRTEMQNLSDSVDNSVPSVTENFGFAKDIDVAKTPEIVEEKYEEPAHEEIKEINETPEDPHPAKTRRAKGINGFLIATRNILAPLIGTMVVSTKKLNVKKVLSIFTKIPKGKTTIIAPLILFLIIAIVASYLLLIKATVEITLDPKIVEQDKNILFSTINRTDPNENTIGGEFVTASEEGTVSTSTTGKKDVGTKAKGTVTVFNSLSQNKTLTERTIIKATNGLAFTLDSSLTIKAVASHSADETVAPEKATISVTASELGKEYNLPSGTKFSIGSFSTSDLIAKNDNPFSGGTKKEVTVVSLADQTKLEKELPEQLEDEAKKNLLEQIGKDKILLPVFISNSLSKKSLNVKVGDEANQVTLTGTVEYQGISYDKNDLISFSKTLLEKDVPSNQKIDYNNIKTSVKNIENKDDGEVEANLNIKALLLPKIDEITLAKDIKGKSFKNAEDLLYKLSQIADVNIFLSPSIPLLPKNLPMREKNIKILIKIDG